MRAYWIAAAVAFAGLLVIGLTRNPRGVSKPVAPLTAEEIARSAKPFRIEASNSPVLAVTAGTLAINYFNNELGADAKFKGKRIRVGGTLIEITRFLGDPLLVLRGTGASNVKCFFPPSAESALATFVKGRFAMIDGDVRGLGATGDVVLHNCHWTRPDQGNEFPDVFTPEMRRR
jgi:hypothetical protein